MNTKGGGEKFIGERKIYSRGRGKFYKHGGAEEILGEKGKNPNLNLSTDKPPPHPFSAFSFWSQNQQKAWLAIFPETGEKPHTNTLPGLCHFRHLPPKTIPSQKNLTLSKKQTGPPPLWFPSPLAAIAAHFPSVKTEAGRPSHLLLASQSSWQRKKPNRPAPAAHRPSPSLSRFSLKQPQHLLLPAAVSPPQTASNPQARRPSSLLTRPQQPILLNQPPTREDPAIPDSSPSVQPHVADLDREPTAGSATSRGKWTGRKKEDRGRKEKEK